MKDERKMGRGTLISKVVGGQYRRRRKRKKEQEELEGKRQIKLKFFYRASSIHVLLYLSKLSTINISNWYTYRYLKGNHTTWVGNASQCTSNKNHSARPKTI